MNSARVTVVIPCFNSASTIAETVGSVSLQTFDDFEILAIDDGSSDGTVRVLRVLAEAEPRLRIIEQANAGVSAARNAAIKLARGDIIALLDSDDLWLADFLSTHVSRLDQLPDLGVSFSRVRFVDAQSKPTGETPRPKLDGIEPADILFENPCSTCSTMAVRRSVFDEVGLFDASLRRAEDQEWLFRVCLSRWRLSGVDAILTDYRNNGDGLSSDLEKMLAGYCVMIERARTAAPDIVKIHAGQAMARMLRYLARRAIRLGREQQIARGYILRALRHSPALLFREPRSTGATLLASLIPGGARLVYGQGRPS